MSTPLAVVLTLLGVAAMTSATVVARREPLPRRGVRPGRGALLLPWVASVLVVVLLLRGAVAGALVVGLGALLWAGVLRARARAQRTRRDGR